MSQASAATGNSAGSGRAPARIADATRARELALAFDLAAPAGRLLRQSLPHLPRAARARSRAPHARRRLFPLPLRRLRRRLQGHGRLLLRQEARVRAQVRRRPALRAPHHEPRLQRPAAAHARAPDHRRGPHAACHRRHGGADGGAGRRPARCDGRQGQRRPDRRPGGSRAGGGDRQPAGGAARRARTAARLVACHPGRARAGDQRGAARARRTGGRGVRRLSAPAGGRPARASGRSRAATC